MSHLGDRITALVDDRLDHDTRDLVLGHLLDCPECRAEAEAQRLVKRQLAEVNGSEPSAALLGKLYALPVTQLPAQPSLPRLRVVRQRGSVPVRRPAGPVRHGRQRRKLALAGSLSVGAATMATAFVIGGQPTGPAVSPSVDTFTVRHAATSGSVPLNVPDANAVRLVTPHGP
ncbi:MAG: anti-sigma factor family protein [Streptosporangiales bacterium]